MKKYLIAAALLAAPVALVSLHAVHAQMPGPMSQHMPQMHQMRQMQGMPHGGSHAGAGHTGAGHPGADHAATPKMPGQDAFGTIQEIVTILEADPKTDWTKVDLEALRQHLIDMNDVTLKSDAKTVPVAGGIEATITGTGRTVDAIQRMVTAHSAELGRMNGWTATAEKTAAGVRLTVTSADPAQTARIRGLGFIGLMVSGSHHQPHHLAMAKGEFAHAHQ
jgi:hypothetical protein